MLSNVYHKATIYLSMIKPTAVEKMRTELANINHCAVLFLSRAAVNVCWYYYTKRV